MSAISVDRCLRTSQSSPLSKPRAVYSIDQILGNHRRNTISGNYLKLIMRYRLQKSGFLKS